MTLTEQWKKGKLPKGYYYAEDNGEELIIHIQEKNGSVMGDDFNLEATDWIKPIAPVPSYEEWQKVLNIDFNNEVLRLENAKLKELLHSLKCCLTSENIEPRIRIDKSLGKIDEVLK